MMTIDEARQFLRNDSAAFPRWCEASAVICESPEAKYDDYLLCLTRRGLPAEMAACALYTRTKRPREDDAISSVIVDLGNWTEYLKNQGLKA